jgi:superfamily II DNA/RNA helicase
MMARGLDISDIDWVVQYDIPKHSSWFVHRSGRTARRGKSGQALLMLTNEEEGYADFIKNYEHIEFKKLKIDGLTNEAATEMRDKVRDIARSSR